MSLIAPRCYLLEALKPPNKDIIPRKRSYERFFTLEQCEKSQYRLHPAGIDVNL
jgi:hypothetical protein